MCAERATLSVSHPASLYEFGCMALQNNHIHNPQRSRTTTSQLGVVMESVFRRLARSTLPGERIGGRWQGQWRFLLSLADVSWGRLKTREVSVLMSRCVLRYVRTDGTVSCISSTLLGSPGVPLGGRSRATCHQLPLYAQGILLPEARMWPIESTSCSNSPTNVEEGRKIF